MVCIEQGCLESSHGDISANESGQRTWMWCLRDRQASLMRWIGAGTVERPNRREMGDSSELAYSWSVHTSVKSSMVERIEESQRTV